MEDNSRQCFRCVYAVPAGVLDWYGGGMNQHLKLKNRLRERRQANGWTQTQLADMIGSTKNTISSIETGQFCPTAYLAALLCKAFDCTFEDLFYLELE